MKESDERQECSAAMGRRAFKSSKTHLCVQLPVGKKKRCSVQLGVFVFVDLVPKYMQTVHSTWHWEDAVAVATSNKLSQCLEVGERGRERMRETEKGTDKRRR